MTAGGTQNLRQVSGDRNCEEKVMGDGGLEEPLESLPDDPDDEESQSRLTTAYKPPICLVQQLERHK